VGQKTELFLRSHNFARNLSPTQVDSLATGFDLDGLSAATAAVPDSDYPMGALNAGAVCKNCNISLYLGNDTR